MTVEEITAVQWLVMGVACLVGIEFGKGAAFWKW